MNLQSALMIIRILRKMWFYKTYSTYIFTGTKRHNTDVFTASKQTNAYVFSAFKRTILTR